MHAWCLDIKVIEYEIQKVYYISDSRQSETKGKLKSRLGFNYLLLRIVQALARKCMNLPLKRCTPQYPYSKGGTSGLSMKSLTMFLFFGSLVKFQNSTCLFLSNTSSVSLDTLKQHYTVIKYLLFMCNWYKLMYFAFGYIYLKKLTLPFLSRILISPSR